MLSGLFENTLGARIARGETTMEVEMEKQIFNDGAKTVLKAYNEYLYKRMGTDFIVENQDLKEKAQWSVHLDDVLTDFIIEYSTNKNIRKGE